MHTGRQVFGEPIVTETEKKPPNPAEEIWRKQCDQYPISLYGALFWLAALVSAQIGLQWLAERYSWRVELGGTTLSLALAVMVVMTPALLFYWRVRKKSPFSTLGLSLARLKGDLALTLVAIAVLAAFYALVVGAVLLYMHVFTDDPRAGFSDFLARALIVDRPAVHIISVVVFFPVLEEIWYRGLMYTPLRDEFGKWWAIILLSIVFAAAHGSIPINQFFGGLVFAWVYERRGTLVAPILLHAAGNGSLVLAGYAAQAYGLIP